MLFLFLNSIAELQSLHCKVRDVFMSHPVYRVYHKCTIKPIIDKRPQCQIAHYLRESSSGMFQSNIQLYLDINSRIQVSK